MICGLYEAKCWCSNWPWTLVSSIVVTDICPPCVQAIAPYPLSPRPQPRLRPPPTLRHSRPLRPHDTQSPTPSASSIKSVSCALAHSFWLDRVYCRGCRRLTLSVLQCIVSPTRGWRCSAPTCSPPTLNWSPSSGRFTNTRCSTSTSWWESVTSTR